MVFKHLVEPIVSYTAILADKQTMITNTCDSGPE